MIKLVKISISSVHFKKKKSPVWFQHCMVISFKLLLNWVEVLIALRAMLYLLNESFNRKTHVPGTSNRNPHSFALRDNSVDYRV